MTQAPNSADQGDNEESDQAQAPLATPETANGAPESFEESAGKSLLETLGITDDVEAEAQTADSDQGETTAEAQGEQPATAAAETPDEAMERWLTKVAANPRSINEIPAKHHPQIMERVLTAERELQQSAAAMAYRQGMTDGQTAAQREATIAQAVAEIDSVKAEDPAAYVEWRETYPDRATAYDQAKRPKPAPGNPDGASAAVAIATAAQSLVSKLAEYPEAKARIEAKSQANPNLYLQTPAGLAELSADIGEEIAADRIAARTSQDEPATKAVNQRQQAAEGRKAIPRPDIADGRGGAGEAPLTDNVDELLGQGFAEAMKDGRTRRSMAVR